MIMTKTITIDPIAIPRTIIRLSIPGGGSIVVVSVVVSVVVVVVVVVVGVVVVVIVPESSTTTITESLTELPEPSKIVIV